MQTRLFFTAVIGTTALMAAVAFSSGKPKTGECACKLKTYITHNDTGSVRILNKPNGTLKFLMKADRDEPTSLTVSASKRGWLQVEKASGDDNEKATGGWVAGTLVSVFTRNAEDEGLVLFKKADATSGEAGQLWGMQEVAVNGCCGDWALIQGKDKSGKPVKGWLDPKMICDKPDGDCK